MLPALGGALSLVEGLESLMTVRSSAAASGQGQSSGGTFDFLTGLSGSGTSLPAPSSSGARIAPQTMGALIEAQGQSRPAKF